LQFPFQIRSKSKHVEEQRISNGLIAAAQTLTVVQAAACNDFDTYFYGPSPGASTSPRTAGKSQARGRACSFSVYGCGFGQQLAAYSCDTSGVVLLERKQNEIAGTCR
jgi:hypothetical protein